jgi:hypothetical protein
VGLYISRGHGPTLTGLAEPALFSEPALYLVRPDGTLYFGTTQTMPFARPHFGDVLTALDFVIAKDYPARGEVTNTELPQLVEVSPAASSLFVVSVDLHVYVTKRKPAVAAGRGPLSYTRSQNGG